MAKERTLSIIKPDATRRNLTGKVNAKFEEAGLRIVAQRRLWLTTEQAGKFYAVHKERPFYGSLISFLTSGPTVAMVLEGREAVAVARNLIGATDGVKAAPGTIRGDYAISVQNNLIHGSDSVENAAAEIALWFTPAELVDWKAVDQAWIE